VINTESRLHYLLPVKRNTASTSNYATLETLH